MRLMHKLLEALMTMVLIRELLRVPIERKRQFAKNGNYPMLEFPLSIEIYTDI